MSRLAAFVPLLVLALPVTVVVAQDTPLPQAQPIFASLRARRVPASRPDTTRIP